MSHFKLFVVGDDVEALLEKFDENLDIEFFDCTEECAEEWEKYQKDKKRMKENPYATMLEFAEDYFGYKIEDGKPGYWRNPQAKWDWWQEGGRYSAYLVNKDGVQGDSFKVKDIDFEAMERRNAANAAQWWEEAHQEKNAVMKSFLYGIEDGMTREQYITLRTGVSAYAFLVGEEWVEKGEMGWFGISTNEKDSADWETALDKFIKGLDPEQTLTVVDCHI